VPGKAASAGGATRTGSSIPIKTQNPPPGLSFLPEIALHLSPALLRGETLSLGRPPATLPPMRRLRLGKVPDPLRAHGAIVFLALSVLAGALSAIGQGFLPALLAGFGFSGVFLIGSGMAIGVWRGRRRLAIGFGIAVLAPVLALALGANPAFFAYGMLALFPAAASAWFAERRGFQSPVALALGVCAIVVAAPSAACAGGATLTRSGVLLVLLVPFFVWRTLRIRYLLTVRSDLNRSALKKIGQREAVLAGGWTFLAVFLIHFLP